MTGRSPRLAASTRRGLRAASAPSGARTSACPPGGWSLGRPREELARLMDDIRANGHTSYLEVVSETEEATLASARAAAEIGPDYLIGGTLVEPGQEIIAGTE